MVARESQNRQDRRAGLFEREIPCAWSRNSWPLPRCEDTMRDILAKLVPVSAAAQKTAPRRWSAIRAVDTQARSSACHDWETTRPLIEGAAEHSLAGPAGFVR